MSKAPSTETQLRTARAELKRVYADLISARQLATAYRARATKAEQEAAEWKQRFDVLLRRDEERKGSK